MNGPLDRQWLLAHLPHAGRMNLLDHIVSWDATTIAARAIAHRDADHPLRRGGCLPITAGIEYGAQTAAAHGAATSGARSPAGFIASLRGVAFHAPRLDDALEPLDIVAEQMGESPAGVLYRFEVSAARRMLVEGRLAVAFAR